MGSKQVVTQIVPEVVKVRKVHVVPHTIPDPQQG